ncbi:hypothetical protein KIN20_026220 [Parelaphostrongylus tenuis]|uniref:SUI1 domain-containing protein n=1 Tax=Parelaphostrongylus tenuis TaxID=148309 RepID=A0AAD5QXW2_PARTN|nr:hypothetical protein KIN20_026220 [Parelaphostrongylus tenuis]
MGVRDAVEESSEKSIKNLSLLANRDARQCSTAVSKRIIGLLPQTQGRVQRLHFCPDWTPTTATFCRRTLVPGVRSGQWHSGFDDWWHTINIDFDSLTREAVARMFRKPFSVKKNTNLRNSDTKKLLQRIPEEAAAVLPKKALVAHVRLQAFNGTIINLYTVDKEPMFFDFDPAGFLFPTLYFTWINPAAFPVFVVHESVLQYLENGADLMLPAVIRERMPLSEFPRGSPVTILTHKDGQIMGPMVVGAALMSSEEMVANNFKGKGVQVLHIFKDTLWEFGSRKSPSVLNLDDIFKITDEVEGSEEKEHPPSDIGEQPPCENGMLADVSANDASSSSDESMDDLLLRCFLAALKFRLEKLPMDVGQFYSTCLLKCVPSGRHLDVKKTKYKKFSVFLNEVNKSEDGPLIEIRNNGKGCDTIVEVFKSHPALRSFTVSDELVHDEQAAVTCGPKIHEFYSITSEVLPILQCCGKYSKGQLLAVPEIRQIVTDYELNQDKMVRLDPILANVTKIPGEVTDWNTLMQKIQSKMTKTFVLRMPDGRELVRKVNMPKIMFKVETRSGNKKVTIINNLAVFGIDTKKLCQQIQVGAATSATSTSEAPNCEGPQITVLGNQVKYVGDLLQKDYGIEKKYIDGLELGIKKKQK